MKFILLIILATIICTTLSFAQDSTIEFDDTPPNTLVESSFHGATVVNSQNTNVVDKGFLNILISHRFGAVTDGAFNLFGLDYSVVRLGGEYGLSKKLSVGAGRTSLGKRFDSSLKYRILTQTKGEHTIPVTITVHGNISFSSSTVRAFKLQGISNAFEKNLNYVWQVLISKEVCNWLSLQITPTYLHQNFTNSIDDPHNKLAFGVAISTQISKKIYLNGEYHKKLFKSENYDPFGIGIDIVTGGHVFKIHFTNSTGIIDSEFLTQTTDNFFRGRIHFGFTLLRSLAIQPSVKGGKIK